MHNLIFTVDYEIHGNGDGHPMALMIEPTYRLMTLLEKYGAKLVIFADVAEILKFREYYETTGRDDFCYRQITEQLGQALQRGHDVQLHIHSSYFGARYHSGTWRQNWKNYNLAGLSADQIRTIVRTCKEFLEETLRPVQPEYECYAFRAANWAMHPTRNLALALVGNGICIDSSVYKYGKQRGWVSYDYSNAHDAAFPYRASCEDICDYDPEGKIVEFPIYCQLKPIPAFLSPIRIYRMLRARRHRHERNPELNPQNGKSTLRNSFGLNALVRKYPRKFDFNQMTSRQMIDTLESIDRREGENAYITLIGHSKSFIRYNEYTLGTFLQYVTQNNDHYRFTTFPSRDALLRRGARLEQR